uniref:Nuclear receptor n=1 Tax=Brachionus calyciflorus TaxID=104777 RepID=A0A221CB02_9BILA|nr:nuclear receptor [Brachionus calyciflorus]
MNLKGENFKNNGDIIRPYSMSIYDPKNLIDNLNLQFTSSLNTYLFNTTFNNNNTHTTETFQLNDCQNEKNKIIKKTRSTFPFGKCKVCNDKATGVHYGIATCEGCKGFFKRSTLKKEKYRCFFGNNCPLTPDNRNRCKACRYRRCCEVGMSIQGVKMGRIPKAEKEKASKVYYRIKISTNFSNCLNLSQNEKLSKIDEYLFNNNSTIINILKSQTPFKSSNLIANRYHSNYHEIDDSYHIITRLLSDKIYQIYLEHNEKVDKLLERAYVLINHGVKNFEGFDAHLNDVWDGLLESIPIQVKNLIDLCKEIPGLNELGQKDLTNLVNNRLFDYFLIKHSPLFINGESYMMLPNKIQYSRYWMKRVISNDMIESMFKFADEFNSLKMTTKEVALMYPFVLTVPDENYKDPMTISSLNEYYYKALMYEFDLNRRSCLFVNRWKHLVSTLPEINEMQAKRIGNLTPKSNLE